MEYKSILVHLDASPRCAERVAIATRLALDFDAHLTGLYAATFHVPSAALAEGAEQFAEVWRQQHRERASEAAGRFREHTARAGLGQAEVRVADGDPARAVALFARYADLLVLGQPDPDEDRSLLGVPAEFAEQAIQSVSRPVLVVPYAGTFPRLGERVLVAWDTSRTATRAVTDALPILKRAANVTVLVVNPESTGDHGDVPGADIALYLARHGVKVEAMENHTREVEPGTWLVSRACDLQSDLIVMGGYGHSWLRDLVFGGVTRSVMGQMTVPILMEH